MAEPSQGSQPTQLTQGFDLTEARTILAREDAGESIHLKDGAGHPMFFGLGDARQPVTACVRGWHSPVVRARWEANQEKIKTAKEELTAEQRAVIEREFAADCLTGWSGFFDGDAELPFTRENAIAVLHIPWILVQVDGAVFEHSRFFPNKPAS